MYHIIYRLEECSASGDGDEVTLSERRDVMSAMENKKLMQDIFAAVAAGNRALLLESLADDVTMRVTGQNSWSQTFKGKASLVRDLYGHLNTLLADGRRTIPLRLIADGDHVVVEARGDMVTKAGVRYENEY
jgi:ketosteroid isomerase-like protein